MNFNKKFRGNGQGHQGQQTGQEVEDTKVSVNGEEVLFQVLKARKEMPVYSMHYISCGDIVQGVSRILREDNSDKISGYLGCSINYNAETKLPEIYTLWDINKCSLINNIDRGRSYKGMAPAAAALLQQTGGNKVSFDAYPLLNAMNGLFFNYEEGNHGSIRYMYDGKTGIVGYKIDIESTIMAIHKIDPTGASGSRCAKVIEYHRKDKQLDSYYEFCISDLENMEELSQRYLGGNANNNNGGYKPKFKIVG